MENLEPSNQHSFFNQDFPPQIKLFFAILFVLFGAMIGAAIILSLAGVWGYSIEEAITQLTGDSPANLRNYVRLGASINQLFMFLIPSVVFLIIFYRYSWKQYLGINSFPPLNLIVLGTLFIFFAFPVAQFAFWINKQIPLPEWMMSMEDSTNEMITNLLITDHPYELLLNVFVIAIIPALGEELLFRGVIQKQLEKWFKHPVVAVWVAAVIFSTIHFQFQGFIPRVILGAVLGYLFYWTGNLWVPVIGHFFNNAAQVLIQFFYEQDMSQLDLEEADQLPWGIAAFSAFLLFVVARMIRRAVGSG